MKEAILFDAITNLPDAYVEEASNYVNRRPQLLKTAGLLVACLALVVTVTLALPYLPLFRAGSSAPCDSAPPITDYKSEATTEDCCEPESTVEAGSSGMAQPEAEEEPADGAGFSIQSENHSVVWTQNGDQYTLETQAETPETITIAYPGEVAFVDDGGNVLESNFNGETTTAELAVVPEAPLAIWVMKNLE